MPAYAVTLCNVTNPEKYAEYAKLAGPAVLKYGGKFLARGGKREKMEGGLDYSRVVIVEFADMEAAKRFYNSPEYQAARSNRIGAADFNMTIVEG